MSFDVFCLQVYIKIYSLIAQQPKAQTWSRCPVRGLHLAALLSWAAWVAICLSVKEATPLTMQTLSLYSSCNHVYFCCTGRYFNMGVYED